MQQNLNEDGITGVIPVGEKYMLTIREAACYFNIGVIKIGSMSVRVIKVTPVFARSVPSVTVVAFTVVVVGSVFAVLSLQLVSIVAISLLSNILSAVNR